MYAAHRLGNGLPVVTDTTLGLQSFTACLAVPMSARDELADESGLTHLLEHLVMLAPSGPDGSPLCDWVGDVGGESNATTRHETVTYWARVPADAAVECVERLVTSVTAPAITDEHCAAERRVVVAELSSAAADPIEASTRRFAAALFGDHPLGRPVGGVAADVPEVTAARLLDRQRRALARDSVCLSLVGPAAVMPAVLDAVAAGPLAALPASEDAASTRPAPQPPPGADLDAGADLADADSVCLTVGGLGASRHDPLWPAFEVLAAAIGGLPGSVLYRRLRNELGVSCELYSHTTRLSDLGLWRVEAGCAPDDVQRVAKVVRQCLEEAADLRLGAAALATATRQAMGAVLIDNEDPVARAQLNAMCAVDGRTDRAPVDLDREAIAAVTAADVAAAAARVLATHTAVVAS